MYDNPGQSESAAGQHVVYPAQRGLPLRVRALVDFMTERVTELLERPCLCPKKKKKDDQVAKT